jgi:hypothetical protein
MYFEPWALAAVVIAVLIDLIARGLAYNKIDSICLDVCIFSFVYKLATMVSTGTPTRIEVITLSILFVIFASVTIIHRWVLQKTHDLVEPHLTKDLTADKGRWIETISKFLLEVDLFGKKDYKRKARESLVYVMGLCGVKQIDPNQFMLNPRFRRTIHVIFILFGIMSIAIVTLKVS